MSQRREEQWHGALGVSKFGNASRDMHNSQHARNSIVVFTGTLSSLLTIAPQQIPMRMSGKGSWLQLAFVHIIRGGRLTRFRTTGPSPDHTACFHRR
jgi:hypothetical protein